MSDLARLLNLAARLYSCGGRGDADMVLQAGTVRIPLRLVGFDEVRNQLTLELDGSRDREIR